MEKIKIGVFGAHRGMTMIKVLSDYPEAKLVAVCDKYEPLLESVKKVADEHHTTVATYTDFEDFIHHDMDAVVLANYATEHAPYAIRLMKAGKHVLSEVLPCETIAQAVELIETVESTGMVYAYAENYCYMPHSFTMRHRYENGEIGDVMYAEGEYVHDCAKNWPNLTYGDPDHWRNNGYPTFYCTHSTGPMLFITGRRPVRVTGFTTQANPVGEPRGRKMGRRAAVEMITLDNGAVARSMHGELKREPGIHPYRIYGTKGCMESELFCPEKLSEGEEWRQKIFVYREGAEVGKGESEVYAPDLKAYSDMFFANTGHGGSDFYPCHYFIQKILGREEGKKYSIDVYHAVDMGLVGVMAYRSILAGGVPMDIPDLRKPEEREKWRHDVKCTNPAIASGEDLLPCAPEGNYVYPPEEYERVKQMWLEGQKK